MLLDLYLNRHVRKMLACFAEGDPPADPPAAPGSGDPPAGGGGAPPGETPPGEPPAAGGEPPPAGAAPPAPATDWRDRQIDRQHRKIKELEGQASRAAELAAENERLKQLVEARDRTAPPAPGAAPAAPAPAPSPASRPEPASAGVTEEAVRFKIDVENLTAKLQTDHAKEWPEAAKNFEKVGGIPPTLMQDILGTDDPAFVLIQLGKNPEKYQNLLDLPPARQRNELFKIAQEKTAPPPAPPKPSGAPAPVGHIAPPASAAPAGSINLYDDKVEDDRWYAERMRQKRESQGRPWSFGGRSGAAR